jgi:alpha-L-fucosidase
MRIKTLLILPLLTCTFAFSQTAATDPTAPTHYTKSAAEIDREWQASVAKYDAKRAEILSAVDRQDNDGPYRADWETLRKFEIPQRHAIRGVLLQPWRGERNSRA